MINYEEFLHNPPLTRKSNQHSVIILTFHWIFSCDGPSVVCSSFPVLFPLILTVSCATGDFFCHLAWLSFNAKNVIYYNKKEAMK